MSGLEHKSVDELGRMHTLDLALRIDDALAELSRTLDEVGVPAKLQLPVIKLALEAQAAAGEIIERARRGTLP